MDKKDKIISKIQAGYTIPVDSLVTFINEGTITQEELEKELAKVSQEETLNNLRNKLKEKDQESEKEEESAWTVLITKYNKSNLNYSDILELLEGIKKYKEKYTRLNIVEHLYKINSIYANLDDKFWKTIEDAPKKEKLNEKQLKEKLNNYLEYYPQGVNVDACKSALEDLPWFICIKGNPTIQELEDFLDGQDLSVEHIDEIKSLIENIKDEEDWNYACKINTIPSYQIYIDKHPQGKYEKEARKRIDDLSKIPPSADELIIQELINDKNSYYIRKLKQSIENHIITYEKLKEVFDDSQIEAIKRWREPTQMEFPPAPKILERGLTEVYFWGLRGSGKTCALGAILSAADQIYKIYNGLTRGDTYYRDKLANIFVTNGVCTLPIGNPQTPNISQMCIQLTDKDSNSFWDKIKGVTHEMNLIDLAGECITGIYRELNQAAFPNNPSQNLVQCVTNYLKDDYNQKIHFFIVEYGQEEGLIDGLTQANILSTMANFLVERKILRRSTVGVYVIVTKTDKIDCSVEERPKRACEYVEKQLGGFWENLKEACEQARISEPRTLSFSIGDVFLQNLCKFNAQDTKKIIDKLILKTPPTKGLFDRLRE